MDCLPDLGADNSYHVLQTKNPPTFLLDCPCSLRPYFRDIKCSMLTKY